MRRAIVTAVAMLFVALGAVAQEHDDAMVMAPLSPIAQQEHLAHLREVVASGSSHGPVIPQPASVNTAAVKNFTITAKSFVFTVSPSPFVVNQGDVVNITLTVPSNDSSGFGHGILMDTYIDPGVDVGRGQTKQFQFTANNAGTFQFICDVPACGTGHSSMSGILMVNSVANPAPTISSISPTSGSTAGGTVVTISGTGFSSNATVKFGTSPATNVSVPSSTTITATAPAHAAGKIDLIVTNGDGQSATLLQGFTYAAAGPTITTISPSTGPTSGGTLVTITGTGFQSGATVTFGALPASDVIVTSATSITARTPLGPASQQLVTDVVVTNPDSSRATSTGGFTYSVPPLAIISISPNLVVPIGVFGSGPTVVTIFGAGFTNALTSSVTVGGIAATNVQVIDPITIRATFPPHVVGMADVVVTIGGNSVTLRNGFLWQNPPPRRRPARH